MTQQRTTKNSARYMKRFMRYPTQSIRLVQGIFRHKLVHLAQPKSVVEDRTRTIAWRYYHHDKSRHLKVIKFKTPSHVKGLTPYKLYCNYGFAISISQLKADIIMSVFTGSTSYYSSLKSNKKLQINFRRYNNSTAYLGRQCPGSSRCWYYILA
jgi:hypothetical protein